MTTPLAPPLLLPPSSRFAKLRDFRRHPQRLAFVSFLFHPFDFTSSIKSTLINPNPACLLAPSSLGFCTYSLLFPLISLLLLRFITYLFVRLLSNPFAYCPQLQQQILDPTVTPLFPRSNGCSFSVLPLVITVTRLVAAETICVCCSSTVLQHPSANTFVVVKLIQRL